MSTVKSAYQTAFARQSAALKKSVKKQTQVLRDKQAQKKSEAQKALRDIYTEHLRKIRALDQDARAKGESGGYVINQKIASHGTAERQTKETTQQLKTEIASIQSQIDSKLAAAEQRQQSLQAAYEKKMASLAESEAKAKAKAQAKAAKSSSGGRSSSSLSVLKNKQSKALSMMKMGIYDESFAPLLGISDKKVRDVVDKVRRKGAPRQKTKTQH